MIKRLYIALLLIIIAVLILPYAIITAILSPITYIVTGDFDYFVKIGHKVFDYFENQVNGL